MGHIAHRRCPEMLPPPAQRQQVVDERFGIRRRQRACQRAGRKPCSFETRMPRAAERVDSGQFLTLQAFDAVRQQIAPIQRQLAESGSTVAEIRISQGRPELGIERIDEVLVDEVRRL